MLAGAAGLMGTILAVKGLELMPRDYIRTTVTYKANPKRCCSHYNRC